MTTEQTLLPIGTKVRHFDGGPDTHGIGTIIGYNGVEENPKAFEYLKLAESGPSEVQELAAAVAFTSMYSKDRYPYVVRFSPSKEHPDGLKEVYGPSEVFPV